VALESDVVLDQLAADFGANYAFALDVFDRYHANPRAVERSWRDYFDRLTGAPPAPDEQEAEVLQYEPLAAPLPITALDDQAEFVVAAAPVTRGGRQRDVAPAAQTGDERAQTQTAALATRGATRTLAPPAVLMPGDIAQPIRGSLLRLVENMELSLLVPSATSIRTVPVRTLEENRQILNRTRDHASPKVSVAHIIAWAILRALETFPRMNDAFADVEGRPHRIQRDSVRLGIAVDVARGDGTRTLLVPNLKDGQRLSFVDFLRAFDDLVARARTGKLGPDDFMGTTVSYTNPGTVGTTTSAPRLMHGQGLIVASGAMDYPAEYRSMSDRALSLLGISKVLTLTSTYDHRIIQGAESGLFLARLEELLRGDDGFYERIFDERHVPHRPVRWATDTTPPLLGSATAPSELSAKQAQVLQLIRAFRVRGHLVANLDPLESRRAPHQELDPATYGLTLWDLDREFFTDGLGGHERASLRETIETLRETYCGSVAAEYMHIADPERKEWLQERMESTRNRSPFEPPARKRLLERLIEAESFERFLHTRYLGHKRFSIEGVEALIPMLCRLLSDAARAGVAEAIIGMPHRGRLNVLHNIVGKPLAQIFSEFEESRDPDLAHGSGDVKYHLGARGVHHTGTGEPITVSVAPNASHLEFVNAVVEGMVRARQDALADQERQRVLPILLHGDAAFSGEGIVAETLNLSLLPGYTTGGTVHIVVNNQIGFTTSPENARSSTYCTDVARMVQAPILHVNADDPEACLHVVVLAFEYRQRFRQDVVIDLVGYRRWGHSEGDEPSYTQPLLYARIQSHPPVAESYGERLQRESVLSRDEVAALWAKERTQMQQDNATSFVAAVSRRAANPPATVDASALRGRLRVVLAALSSVPSDFAVHPKLAALLQKRAALGEGKGAVDWAAGEALAFGTLLLEGIHVRLSGQDSARGTFSQRHAVLYDVRTGRAHVSLNSVAGDAARFEVWDSSLSEAAVLAFELGYSFADHRSLVIWEAQFGDFANAAQVIIDQFLVAAEAKWGQPTAVVLLLPHGHEGQGPEHSSARVERFLALAAEDNLRLCWPSTPAQFFHLLRRQARDPVEKPLVVLTPKSLLRHPRCVSTLADLAEGSFSEVLDDETTAGRHVRRVLLTSGKLFYELAAKREQLRVNDVALVRIEQLYPFPGPGLASVLTRYADDADLVWVQEEPKNMGAWRFLRDRFLEGEVPGLEGRPLRYLGRRPSAAPAPGTLRAHQREQDAILAAAFE